MNPSFKQDFLHLNLFHMICILRVTGVLVLTILCAGNGFAQLQRIVINGSGPHAHFGATVSVHDNIAMLAAPGYGEGTMKHSGKAQFYRYNGSTWEFDQEVTAQDGSAYDAFGMASAIGEDMAVVGAPANGAGKVYTYHYNGTGWQPENIISIPRQHRQKLLDLRFGEAVALSDDFLAISCPGYSTGGTDGVRTGAVFLYERSDTGWVFTQRIDSPNSERNMHFGRRVVIDHTSMLINAPRADGGDHESGAVYLYTYDGGQWRHSYTFIDPTSLPHELFGISMDIHDNQVIIGVSMFTEDVTQGPKGAAHIFQQFGDQWIRTALLTHPTQKRNDLFGSAVQIEGDLAIVSAPGADKPNIIDVGSIYTFRFKDGFWLPEEVLIAPLEDRQQHLQLGNHLHFEKGNLLVSAHLWDGDEVDSGCAYHISLDVNTAVHPAPRVNTLLHCYPNPTKGRIFISADAHEGRGDLEVFDLAGQRVFSRHVEDMASQSGQLTLDLSMLHAGTYFIYLLSEGIPASAKIIKQ